jgi:hypothetical protein
MYRLFGRQKEPAAPAPAAAAAPAAPPPDAGEQLKRRTAQIGELQQQVLGFNQQLQALGARLRDPRLPAFQRAQLQREAQQLLMRRKQREQQLGQLQAGAFNLEQLQFAMQQQRDNKEQVEMMRHMRTEMAAMQKGQGFDAYDVEELQDDLEEAQTDMAEISEVLARPIGAGSAALSDADLESELAALGDMGDLSAVEPVYAPGVAAGAAAEPAAALAAGGGGGGGGYGIPELDSAMHDPSPALPAQPSAPRANPVAYKF